MTQQIESRSTALNRFMMVPIVVGFGLVLATGILIFKMTEDRVADGERITLSLQGDCLSSSKSVVLERAKAVGVGNPIFSEDLRTLTLTLPAIDNAREHIPQLLLRRGVWEMRDDQNLVLSNQDISSAQLSLDESGMPEALLTFLPASKKEAQEYLNTHTSGSTVILLDGQTVIQRPNTIEITDDFRLVSEQKDPRTRMQESADFVILLSNGPLQCQLGWSIL